MYYIDNRTIRNDEVIYYDEDREFGFSTLISAQIAFRQLTEMLKVECPAYVRPNQWYTINTLKYYGDKDQMRIIEVK